MFTREGREKEMNREQDCLQSRFKKDKGNKGKEDKDNKDNKGKEDGDNQA